MSIFSNIYRSSCGLKLIKPGFRTLAIAIVIAGTAVTMPIRAVFATSPVATDIRIGSHASKTRFVIDISEDVKFKVFTLSDPYRVVIDLPEMGWRLPSKVASRKTGVIASFRYGLFQAGLSRVVLDLTHPVKIKAAFVLPPAEGKRYRLVLDLAPTSAEQYMANLRPPTKAQVENIAPSSTSDILPPV